jgi:hypothetical protein
VSAMRGPTSPATVAEIHRLSSEGMSVHAIEIATGIRPRVIRDILARPPKPLELAAIDRATGWAPLCMEPEEWADWQRRNPRLTDHAFAPRPCTDCPLGFAADMRAEGRCNGTPGGVQGDDEIPQEETPMEGEREKPGRRVEVTLELPCPRCEKQDVCGIRPSLEALRSLPVVAPELDPRVSVALAGSIECAAFVRARVRRADAGELDEPRRRNHLTPEGLERMRENGRQAAARIHQQRQGVA